MEKIRKDQVYLIYKYYRFIITSKIKYYIYWGMVYVHAISLVQIYMYIMDFNVMLIIKNGVMFHCNLYSLGCTWVCLITYEKIHRLTIDYDKIITEIPSPNKKIIYSLHKEFRTWNLACWVMLTNVLFCVTILFAIFFVRDFRELHMPLKWGDDILQQWWYISRALVAISYIPIYSHIPIMTGLFLDQVLSISVVLKYLGNAFKTIQKDVVTLHAIDDGTVQRNVQQDLRHLIKCHVEILRIATFWTDYTQNILLFLALLGTILGVFVLSGFFVETLQIVYGILRHSLYLSVYIICCVVLFSLGEYIGHQFQCFHYELSNCNWYYWDISNRNLFKIVLHKSQQRFGIRCTREVYLNLALGKQVADVVFKTALVLYQMQYTNK